MSDLRFFMKNIGAYFILNEMHSKNGIITDANNAIGAGIRVIHYSEKKLRKREVLENAYILSALCKKNNVLFIIEDYPDIATLVSADGVHLTQDFCIEHVRKIIGPEKIIGVNFTSLREAVYAEEKGADYIGVDTRVAPQLTIKGTVGSMKKMRDLLTVPIVALGAFTLEQTQELLVAGIDGVGMMPLLSNEGGIEQYVKQVLAIQDARRAF